MKHTVYSIHDTRVEEWSMPFFQPTDQHAIRSFTTAVNTDDKNNMLNVYPRDFMLYKIGTFETDTGMLNPCNPELITAAHTVLKKEIVENGN